jgi:hypothetical protein
VPLTLGLHGMRSRLLGAPGTAGTPGTATGAGTASIGHLLAYNFRR